MYVLFERLDSDTCIIFILYIRIRKLFLLKLNLNDNQSISSE